MSSTASKQVQQLKSTLIRYRQRPSESLQIFNFFRSHVIFGLVIPLVTAGIFVACNTANTVSYIDGLFMCTSALTETGLNTVLMSSLSFGQQFILYILAQIGSIQFISLVTLFIRRATFNKRFSEEHRLFPTRSNKNIIKDIEAAEAVLNDPEEAAGPAKGDVEGNDKDKEVDDLKNAAKKGDAHPPQNDDQQANKGGGKASSSSTSAQSHSNNNNGGDDQQDPQQPSKSQASSQTPAKSQPQLETAGRGGFPNPLQAVYSAGWNQLRKRYRTNNEHDTTPLIHKSDDGDEPKKDGQGEKREKTDINGKPEDHAKFGRNSNVEELSRDQHVKLARLEISAMSFLIYTVAFYWISAQLVIIIIWAPYFSTGHFGSTISASDPISRTWFAVFQAGSFLNNCGLSLVDTSLTGFLTCYIMLIPGALLILGGNLGYPVGLRGLIWGINYCVPRKSSIKSLTNFVLQHPRRVFFYLFPPYETIALLVAICILTSVDWVCFYILNIGYQPSGTNAVYSIGDHGAVVIDGLIQSTAVRSAGFYVVNIYDTAPALHILYVFMMVFAIYPLALAIRATNVYEEKALGISENRETDTMHGLQHLQQEEGYVNLHLKEQLAYDVWFIIFVTWLICIIERPQLEVPANSSFGNFTIFEVIFEVCSAYANVGLSIGSPSSNTSTSGNFRHLSKLILCGTMIRGRTRGLPIQVDRSIMTPTQLDKHGDPPERKSSSGKAEKEADSSE